MLVKSHNETNSLADMVTWFCEMQMSGDVHSAGRPLLDVARQAGIQVDRCPPAAVTLTFTGHSSKLETAFAKDGESARSERTGCGKASKSGGDTADSLDRPGAGEATRMLLDRRPARLSRAEVDRADNIGGS